MDKQTLIAHCLTYPNAVEDYPFADNDLTIMRHPSGGKWFACIMASSRQALHKSEMRSCQIRVSAPYLQRCLPGLAYEQRTLEHC